MNDKFLRDDLDMGALTQASVDNCIYIFHINFDPNMLVQRTKSSALWRDLPKISWWSGLS